MRKYISAVLLIITVITLTSCTARKAQNEGYLVYRSSPVGVQIEYPDFWEMAEDKKTHTVAFAAPSEGYGDGYRDNVSICVSDLGERDMAFDNYVKSYTEKLPSTIKGYTLVSQGMYALEGYEAYRIVYEGETEDGLLRLQQTFIKNGKYMYIYSFIAEPKSYDYFNKNSEIMLSTLVPLLK